MKKHNYEYIAYQALNKDVAQHESTTHCLPITCLARNCAHDLSAGTFPVCFAKLGVLASLFCLACHCLSKSTLASSFLGKLAQS